MHPSQPVCTAQQSQTHLAELDRVCARWLAAVVTIQDAGVDASGAGIIRWPAGAGFGAQRVPLVAILWYAVAKVQFVVGGVHTAGALIVRRQVASAGLTLRHALVATAADTGATLDFEFVIVHAGDAVVVGWSAGANGAHVVALRAGLRRAVAASKFVVGWIDATGADVIGRIERASGALAVAVDARFRQTVSADQSVFGRVNTRGADVVGGSASAGSTLGVPINAGGRQDPASRIRAQG